MFRLADLVTLFVNSAFLHVTTQASKLCSEAASVRTAATSEQQKIRAKFDNILKAVCLLQKTVP
jgi:hypothetical protein